MSARDDEDELSWWDELRPRSRDEEEEALPPPPDDSFSALEHVKALVQQPLFGERSSEEAPTLRSAAIEMFRSAGLFGNAPVPRDIVPTLRPPQFDPADADDLPKSWKLPARGTLPTILGDDTAAGPARSAVPDIGPPSTTDPTATASSSAPRNAAASATASPLDHPDAQTGLALTAADSLLRRGIDVAVSLAAGNPALARKLIEFAANSIAGVLPEQFRADALTSADAAAAEAERRIGDNDRATRTRVAIGTLANRRSEAEHEHTAAVISGNRDKIAEARQEAIEAWSAERRARGDGEAEINAGARALEREYRKTALRHRLAQMDGAGIQRALAEDEDAKADPALAREVAADILRLRRDEPARVAEASIERRIAEKKRDGRIDTPEEEVRERYKLRLEAQAKRGIPETERRILTNEQRAKFADEYLRIESAQRKSAADAWLDRQVQAAGSYAERFESEIVVASELRDLEQNGSRHSAGERLRQIAELPITSDPSPSSTRSDSESTESAAPGKQVEAEDRRQPEPSATSYSVGAEFGVEQPTSPLRELRKLIGRIRSVAAFKDGGAQLMSDDEVGAYIDEARKYIRPEYQDVFEITVFAVRSGMIPWWRAQERILEYFAPDSTGEAILDGILDFIPIVGQVKGAIEIGEALDGLRIALDEGDEPGAVKFAADAALLLAGLIPILKAGKFAKHIPGLEKLKDILGEFAGGRLPFQSFLEKWNKNWKLNNHHSFPIFMGGTMREGLAELRTGVHRSLHRELNSFLRGIVDTHGRHMRAQKGNPGSAVQRNFTLAERIGAMADFYNGPGNRLKYRNARRQFFDLFPEMAR